MGRPGTMYPIMSSVMTFRPSWLEVMAWMIPMGTVRPIAIRDAVNIARALRWREERTNEERDNERPDRHPGMPDLNDHDTEDEHAH